MCYRLYFCWRAGYSHSGDVSTHTKAIDESRTDRTKRSNPSMRETERRTEQWTTDRATETGRRTFLKAGAMAGATAVGVLATGTASARTESAADLIAHDGESAEVGDGTVTTGATTNSSGELVSLDVHVDGDALSSMDDDETEPHESAAAHLELPSDVDTHQFTFMGLHYNPMGHAPPGIYTVPHFDFHFYMVEEDLVEGIGPGPSIAAYEVPGRQIPEGYVFETPRLVVPEMGEHLLDETAPEFGDGEFTHTYVYGAYDPDIDPKNPSGTTEVEMEGETQEFPVFEGDGEGQLHFVEPMVTNEFMSGLDEGVTADVATPEAFQVEGRYPTAYSVTPNDSGATVSIEGFETFPGMAE